MLNTKASASRSTRAAPKRIPASDARRGYPSSKMESRGRTIDIVIPARNEEGCIGQVIEQTFAALDEPGVRFEMIIVDDGSDDATAEIVNRYRLTYPITLVVLSRNFGKEAAILAGLDQSNADAVVIMDADLQHPVELIPQFLREWRAGFQCVYAVRAHRRDESLVKRLYARLFYTLVNLGSDLRIEPDAVDFRLLDRAVVEALRGLRERVRFMKGLYAWVGFRSKAVPFVPASRYRGRTKFARRALVRLGWDGLTSFSDFPLRLSSLVGVAVSVLSLAYGLYETARTLLFGIDVPGWATLVVAVTFMSGLQMMFLGIIGQYIRNIFLETKGRPIYLVSDVLTSSQAERRQGDASAAPVAVGDRDHGFVQVK